MTVTISYAYDGVRAAVMPGLTGAPDSVGLAGGSTVGIGDHGGAHIDGSIVNPEGTSTGSIQLVPGVDGAIDRLADGNLVIVSQDADSVLFQIVHPVTGGTIIASTDLGLAGESNADVAGLSGGRFVIADQWVSGGQGDIHVWIRNANGSGLVSFGVDSTLADDRNPSVAALGDGNVALAWQRGAEIWYAIYSQNGGIVRAPAALIAAPHGLQGHPSVTATPGGFAIALEDDARTSIERSIFVATLDLAGTLQHYVDAGYHLPPNLPDDPVLDYDLFSPYATTLGNGLVLVGYGGDFGTFGTGLFLSAVDPATGGVSISSSSQTIGAFTRGDRNLLSLAAGPSGQFTEYWQDSATGTIGGIVRQTVRFVGGDGDDDVFTGDELADTIYGYGGNDTLSGGGGNDTIRGELGDDTVDGGEGDDWVTGAWGTDIVSGGGGDDTLVAWVDGADGFDGGTGTDTLDFAIGTAVGINLDSGLYTRDGLTATVTGIEIVLGNSGNDTMTGGFLVDTFRGLGGNDTLDGGFNADVLDGGEGDDTLFGGFGTDTVGGGDGNDTIVIRTNEFADNVDGGNDIDLLDFAGRSDFAVSIDMAAGTYTNQGGTNTISGIENVRGTQLGDVIAGTDAVNELRGMAGNDQLDGGSGDDLLIGGSGVDVLIGGNGDDTYYNPAGDTIVEAAGVAAGAADLVQSGASFSLAAVANVERLELIGGASIYGGGNSLSNIIDGNTGNNALQGLEGADTLRGGDGDDTLDGGLDADSLAGGAGDDTYVNPAGDTIVEAAGAAGGTHDLVRTNAGFNLAAAPNVEDIVLNGGAAANAIGNNAANRLTGNGAANTLNGAGGNDTLDGGAGADTLNGGGGDDTYIDPAIGAGGDTVVEAAGAAGGLHDLIQTAISFNLSTVTNVEDITLAGTAAINAIGNNFANILIGNTGNNILNGGGGADTITGGAGNDTMNGGAGADLFKFATTNTSADRIDAFSTAQDSFDLSGGTFSARAESGGNTTLTHAGGTILVTGVAGLSLTAWNALVVGGAREAPEPSHGRGSTAAHLPPPLGHVGHADFLYA